MSSQHATSHPANAAAGNNNRSFTGATVSFNVANPAQLQPQIGEAASTSKASKSK